MEEEQVKCLENLKNVIEPETGLPITELGLVRIAKENGELVITYIPISAYSPQILVISVGIQLVKECNAKVKIENYYLEEEINKRLEELRNELSRVLSKTSS
ncbi:hypothetical protein SJAV_19100 [Sulfurisphaera javensis]|uniref:DUF59 domain-containing protein n=1 Tax=Sulfurisphaera javensis TaxID=2049879 RepID=A0AAT9GT79_9CREN